MKALFLFSFLTLSAVPSAEAATLRLEQLNNPRDFGGGCGCSVWRGSDETLVWSELGEKEPAVVRVDGTRKELRWISSTERSGTPRLGDRFQRVYSDGSLKLTLRYVTTFVCSAGDEGCEVTRYRVNTLLEQGTARSQLRNLKGDCGC